MPFSWTNWRAHTRRQLRIRGVPALGEALWRGALGATIDLGWALEQDAPLPEKVVVVVGHQRSGTTWLHRMLASHPAACGMPLHNLLVPSGPLPWLAHRCPRPRWFDALQDRLFGGLDPIHRIRLHEAEEDELLLWAQLRSPANQVDAPWPASSPPTHDWDDSAAAHYAQVLARRVRRTGRRVVGKNPHLTHRTDALREALPGVRFVQLVRHPARAIPSRLSLIRAIWRHRFGPHVQMEPHQVEHIVALSTRCYLEGQNSADLSIAYTDLVDHPLDVVRRIHTAFGLEDVTPEHEEALRAAQRTGPSRHAYSLEEFGLDRDALAEALAPIYSRWGFDVSPSAAM
jgi:hypothetical protein